MSLLPMGAETRLQQFLKHAKGIQKQIKIVKQDKQKAPNLTWKYIMPSISMVFPGFRTPDLRVASLMAKPLSHLNYINQLSHFTSCTLYFPAHK